LMLIISLLMIIDFSLMMLIFRLFIAFDISLLYYVIIFAFDFDISLFRCFDFAIMLIFASFATLF